MQIYPAIDIRNQAVVRLHQGDFKREIRYDASPLTLALHYAQRGATWLHLIDLDATRGGRWSLDELAQSIRNETGLRIQTGGGIRALDDLNRAFDYGIDRVVLGHVALTNPTQVMAWLDRFGAERIAIALDTRWQDGEWTLPLHGWSKDSSFTLTQMVDRYRETSLKHVLCTEISRDAQLSGYNLPLYQHLQSLAPHWHLQCSGGARDLADVRNAKQSGFAGAIVGRALLEQRIDLEEAMTC